MTLIKKQTYYAPTYIDFSVSSKGIKTGDNKATLFTRTFSIIEKVSGKRHIKVARGLLFIDWETEEEKIENISKAIKGMKELKELDENPNLDFRPRGFRKL